MGFGASTIVAKKLKVATYNVHKCKGLDGRTRPDRIAKVLSELDADVIALQEVVSIPNSSSEHDQCKYLAQALGMHHCTGVTRKHRGGAYGNVILSKLPIVHHRNHDISVDEHERRGCLRADLEFHESLIHVFNVHLGTAYLERRQQVRKLVTKDILHNEDLLGMRTVVGDFNEWTRGLATQMLSAHLQSADVRAHLNRSRTYPGILPVLHLDHVYYDAALILTRLTLVRNRSSLIASDHLPLVAEFEVVQTS
jgi:endonuclease/exonuclease/phosphatase family metal-dependent hydrolase